MAVEMSTEEARDGLRLIQEAGGTIETARLCYRLATKIGECSDITRNLGGHYAMLEIYMRMKSMGDKKEYEAEYDKDAYSEWLDSIK